jgi:hypothetical protein
MTVVRHLEFKGGTGERIVSFISNRSQGFGLPRGRRQMLEMCSVSGAMGGA